MLFVEITNRSDKQRPGNEAGTLDFGQNHSTAKNAKSAEIIKLGALGAALADFPSGRICGFPTGGNRFRFCPAAAVPGRFSSAFPKFFAVSAFFAAKSIPAGRTNRW
jgi:hypothetical protein